MVGMIQLVALYLWWATTPPGRSIATPSLRMERRSIGAVSDATKMNNRRRLLESAICLTLWPLLPAAAVEVTLRSPQDRLGLELSVASDGTLVIRSVNSNNSLLQPGMILNGYSSMEDLKVALETGPYPMTLVFLKNSSASDSNHDELQIQVLRKLPCPRPSRRNDVLEIVYTSSFAGSNKNVLYDSSERRGTGQPYQMVLGSGDMLPGVALGLYDMCPGEQRRLVIPSRLAYGTTGNRLFGIPPDARLVWEVELVRINGSSSSLVETEED